MRNVVRQVSVKFCSHHATPPTPSGSSNYRPITLREAPQVLDVPEPKPALRSPAGSRCSTRSFDHTRRWDNSLQSSSSNSIHLARAFAQVGQVMLLDEPTNHLDISHQLDILKTLRETGLGVVVALHDLNLATTFCDEVLVLHKGRAVCLGRPADVLTEDLIREVYGVEVRILHPDGDETPLFQFLRPVTQT